MYSECVPVQRLWLLDVCSEEMCWILPVGGLMQICLEVLLLPVTLFQEKMFAIILHINVLESVTLRKCTYIVVTIAAKKTACFF